MIEQSYTQKLTVYMSAVYYYILFNSISAFYLKDRQKKTKFVFLYLKTRLKLYCCIWNLTTYIKIKRDGKGRSRGFGFIRYATYACQVKILQQTHTIAGRKCEVKIPYSQVSFYYIVKIVFSSVQSLRL